MKKLKLAIFDLTDCEGCELQFLALREELAKEGQDFEITNWRLAGEPESVGPFDATFIEGSPMTDHDIEVVKQARKVSEKIITLGSCAAAGGVQASLLSSGRKKALTDVYNEKYQAKGRAPKPVSYYIDVDIHLPGCPINPGELKTLLSALLIGKKFTPAYFPVCLECKTNETDCLFLEEGFCLGPVTKGGCGAICPAGGLRCFGCFGPLKGANLGALKEASRIDPEEMEKKLGLFFSETDEYKEYKIKKRVEDK